MLNGIIRSLILNRLNDKNFLRLMYEHKFHKKLNLKNPETFNEKLQWLKLYDRNPIYTTLVDKYKVKDYVADKIGGEYIIPLLGVWEKFNEIDFNTLPDQFVLKTNHGCGGVYLCKDKRALDLTKIKNEINVSLKNSYYKRWREWPYKNVKKKIIAEQFMMDESGYELKDYKFFCFNGEVKSLFVAKDRVEGKEVTFDFFDKNFNHLPIEQGHKNADAILEKPINYEKMIKLAEKLSEDIPQVRVDFYNCNGKIYFGEMTFYHYSGLVPFTPEKWDKIFGEWIDLSIAYCYKELI